MELAALILSVISLIASLGCLTIMLAKNYFSSHTIQYVNPFENAMGQEIGKPQLDPYQELDLSLSQDEIDELKGRKAKFQ